MSYLENKLLYKIYNEIYYYTFCIKTYYDRINISKIKDLRFNHMYAIDATIH